MSQVIQSVSVGAAAFCLCGHSAESHDDVRGSRYKPCVICGCRNYRFWSFDPEKALKLFAAASNQDSIPKEAA